MKLTLMTPVYLLIILLTVFVTARRGYKKGFVRSFIGLAVLIASAFLGAGVSLLASNALEAGVLELLDDVGFLDLVRDMIGAFTVIVEPLLGMVLNFLCFIPSFLLTRLVLNIIISIIFSSKMKKLSKTDEYYAEDADYSVRHSKRLGAFVGVASGIFVSVLVLAPITGLFKCANDTVDIVVEFSEMDTDEFLPKEAEKVLKLSDDFMLTAVDACGGKMWFNFATSNYCYGQWTNINKELALLRTLDADELLEIMDSISTLDDDSIESLESFLYKISDSAILRLMLTAAVNDMSKAWIDRAMFMGIERPDVGAGYVNDFFDEILFVLSKTNTDTVDDDLATLLRLSAILREYDEIFEEDNYKNAADIFAGGEFVEKIKAELAKNPRMASISRLVDDIMMSTIAAEIDNITVDEEVKVELYTNLSDIMNSSVSIPNDKRVEALTGDIQKALSDYGVYAPDGMVDEVAAALIADLSAGGQTVTPEVIEEYFNKYLGQ